MAIGIIPERLSSAPVLSGEGMKLIMFMKKTMFWMDAFKDVKQHDILCARYSMCTVLCMHSTLHNQ